MSLWIALECWSDSEPHSNRGLQLHGVTRRVQKLCPQQGPGVRGLNSAGTDWHSKASKEVPFNQSIMQLVTHHMSV